MKPTVQRLIAACLCGLALGAAAQPRGGSEPAAEAAVTVTAEAPRANVSAKDVDFLSAALRTALANVRMGELVAERGRDARVREYGGKLQRDYTAHAADVRKRLQPMNVTIPAEPSAEALAQHAALARLSAEELDAAFVQMMIWTHTEAIEQYGAQTHANPNRTLSDLASTALPMLREHLAAVEALR